jgi:hypothetical protein
MKADEREDAALAKKGGSLLHETSVFSRFSSDLIRVKCRFLDKVLSNGAVQL